MLLRRSHKRKAGGAARHPIIVARVSLTALPVPSSPKLSPNLAPPLGPKQAIQFDLCRGLGIDEAICANSATPRETRKSASYGDTGTADMDQRQFAVLVPGVSTALLLMLQ